MNRTLRVVAAALMLTATILGNRPSVFGAEPAAEPMLKLPALIGDNMVLQAGDRPAAAVWGWADPGAAIRVELAGQTHDTQAAPADGRWRIELKALSASSAPLEMRITASRNGRSTTRTIANILVGDVWLCSGQSNMGMALSATENSKEHQAAANVPAICLFTVRPDVKLDPQAECAGEWQPCTPQTVTGFSAAAYFFGKRLHEETDRPIGLVHSSWGGTFAESWISADTLAATPALQATATRGERERTLARQMPGEVAVDDTDWQAPTFDDRDWKPIDLPLYFDYALYPLECDGVIWARRRIEIPADWSGRTLQLNLGKIDDFETTYFNGTEVGKTTRHTLQARCYEVPGELVKPGLATLAVRVTKFGWGGIAGPTAADMRLSLKDQPDQTIPLAGPWRYAPSQLTLRHYSPRLPSALFNAMIAPLGPMSLRGVIWYQGEANANPGTAHLYRQILPALIRDWRTQLRQPELPFYFVQLANLGTPPRDPNETSPWAVLRESQLATLKTVPHTGMAVAIDIGDAADIHPKNKLDVGNRLALWALRDVYGRQLEPSGPLYESMTIEGSVIRIRFTHTGGGMGFRNNEQPKGFAIAGADKRFVWADARIDGDTVIVSSSQVSEPAAVRYAWAGNPEGCNLVNKDNLPASPFRTDQW